LIDLESPGTVIPLFGAALPNKINAILKRLPGADSDTDGANSVVESGSIHGKRVPEVLDG
jgi:hypothetical protein